MFCNDYEYLQNPLQHTYTTMYVSSGLEAREGLDSDCIVSTCIGIHA